MTTFNRFDTGAVAVFLLLGSVLGLARAQAPGDPTPAVERSQPEQIERQTSGMPKVPGAEPIQPKANQPGEVGRERAAARDEARLEEQTGANPPTVWAHQVVGRVAAVDRSTGVVSVENRDPLKPLAFQFAPDSVGSLAVGETIVTRVSYSRSRRGEVPPSQGGPQPATVNKLEGETGERSVDGTVVDVDKGNGRVALRSPETMLYVEVPPRFAQTLTQGDRVNVEMAFSRDLDQAS